MSQLRQSVLQLYRRVIKLSKTWDAADPSSTMLERSYIRDEARTLFRKHANISSETDIKSHMLEAEARIEMAIHYRNPYPRPVNLPPSAYTKKEGKKQGRAQERLIQQSRPVYSRSLDESSGLKDT